jgi:ribose transport system substrate-binding protein
MRWLCGLLVASLLAGCSKPEASKNRLGISVLTLRNPYFKVIADTFKAEGEKAGYEVLVEDADNDLEKQRQQIKTFLDRKAAAIVLCPTKAEGIGAAIQLANKAGVPVFTADLACLDKDAKVASHIATDNKAGGRLAARAMIKALGAAGGKVAIIDFPEAESCRLRVEGFREVIDEHNKQAAAQAKAGRIDIVATQDGGGHREEGRKAAAGILDRNADLAGIFAINDPSALGAWTAVEKAGRTHAVKIISFDGQPEGIEAIEEGKIYDEPMQFPDEIARKTFATIQRYFKGDTVPSQQLIETKLYRHKELKP